MPRGRKGGNTKESACKTKGKEQSIPKDGRARHRTATRRTKDQGKETKDQNKETKSRGEIKKMKPIQDYGLNTKSEGNENICTRALKTALNKEKVG